MFLNLEAWNLDQLDKKPVRKIFPDSQQQQQFFSGGNVLMSYFKNAPSPSPAKRLALQSFLATEIGNPEWICGIKRKMPVDLLSALGIGWFG